MTKKIKTLLVSNYKLDYSNYFPNSGMHFGNVEFVMNTSEDIDAVVICNHPMQVIQANVAPKNIFHIHQEPGDKLYHGFMFGKVVGQKCGHLPLTDITSHPCLNWLVNKTHDQLVNLDTSLNSILPVKNKLFSGVISGHNALNGHYFRLKILEQIKQQFSIDLYGKRHNFIPDKWDALFPYRFSLAMENSAQKDYWTEKIMDCFLSCCLPVYYGCTNIDQYFPKQSYIKLDVNHLNYSLGELKEKLSQEYFLEHYSYLLEARDLCLNKYATAPGLSNIVTSHFTKAPKQQLIIKPFKRSPLTDIKRKLTRNRIAHWITDKQR